MTRSSVSLDQQVLVPRSIACLIRPLPCNRNVKYQYWYVLAMVKSFQVLCTILTTASMASIGLPPLDSDSIHDPASAADIKTVGWSTTDVLEGMLFVQGDFGNALLSAGALGPLSSEQRAALEVALSDPKASEIAHAVSTELQAQYPDHTKRLMDAIRAAEPIAVTKAMEVLGDDLLKTPTMERVMHQVSPVDVWVVAGAVLVVTVAAVGLGVVALASYVAVGSTKVAGQNAIRRSSGPTAEAQEAQLTAAAIQVFHGE